MTDSRSLIEAAMTAARTRASWNSWLETAERPASDHEEAKILRAASLASDIVNKNAWLQVQGAVVCPQGSYYNNTNVRLEADMDLRVQVPQVQIEYMNGLDQARTSHLATYSTNSLSYAAINALVRSNLEHDLVDKFGRKNVDATGEKAIKVHGLDGSRADCDLVPTFELNVFMNDGLGAQMIEGVAILGRTGDWTYNFPDQHHDNGITKRSRTSHRFKRNVRMLKRLNYELLSRGDIARRIPSFYVECLVYGVEDDFFLIERDDRYDRLLRILKRLAEQLADANWCHMATEVNAIKFLFRNNSAWTPTEAAAFVRASINRLTS
jgi:hypothetical protein